MKKEKVKLYINANSIIFILNFCIYLIFRWWKWRKHTNNCNDQDSPWTMFEFCWGTNQSGCNCKNMRQRRQPQKDPKSSSSGYSLCSNLSTLINIEEDDFNNTTYNPLARPPCRLRRERWNKPLPTNPHQLLISSKKWWKRKSKEMKEKWSLLSRRWSIMKRTCNWIKHRYGDENYGNGYVPNV